jgi:hypothetical protein
MRGKWACLRCLTLMLGRPRGSGTPGIVQTFLQMPLHRSLRCCSVWAPQISHRPCRWATSVKMRLTLRDRRPWLSLQRTARAITLPLVAMPPMNPTIQFIIGITISSAAAAPAIARSPGLSRSDRRGYRAAEPRNELPPFHSITSSARASIENGTTRLSALAVLRFTAILNLVGN